MHCGHQLTCCLQVIRWVPSPWRVPGYCHCRNHRGRTNPFTHSHKPTSSLTRVHSTTVSKVTIRFLPTRRAFSSTTIATSSPTSNTTILPSSRQMSDHVKSNGPSCAQCNSPSHSSDGCPHAAAAAAITLSREALPLENPFCAHCRPPYHKAGACPYNSKDLERQAARLHQLEPIARMVLKNGIPAIAPCCPEHAQMDHAALTSTRGLIVQHRSLMPMCPSCVMDRQQDFFSTEFLMSSVDSCKYTK